MFSAEFEAERDLKIDGHLAKLWATVGCPVFMTHGAYTTFRKK